MEKDKRKDKMMRSAALFGVAATLVCSVAAVRSPVAADLRAGRSVSGLLMGTDLVDFARHSDTLMLWDYNPARGRLNLLSIPRDTKIDLPGYQFHRVNEVFSFHYGSTRDPLAAAEEVIKAVHTLLGQTGGGGPRYFLQVDYGGFKRLINLLGGVRIHVDEPMHYDDNAGNLHINHEPGNRLLDGKGALEYVRFRGKSGDRGRILRQMEFVKAVVDRAASPLVFVRAPRLLAAIYGSFHTNMAPWDFLFLALEAKRLRSDRMSPWLLPGKPTGAYWEMDAARTALVLQQVRGEAAPAQELLRASRAARAVTVKVWNGTRREGLALVAARQLRGAGFDVLEWGNYDGQQTRTRVLDRVGAIEKAQNVAHTLGVGSVFSDVEPALRTDVEVVLGDDYSR